MPKRTSAAELAAATVAMRVVLVTMDSHLAGAALRAHRTLASTLPGLQFTIHAAAALGPHASLRVHAWNPAALRIGCGVLGMLAGVTLMLGRK